MRNLIKDSYIIHNGEKLQVTISVGATVAAEDDTMESLLKEQIGYCIRAKVLAGIA